MNILSLIKLATMMRESVSYLFIDYADGSRQIISEKAKHISNSFYLRNKHFYLKNDCIYYWESRGFTSQENSRTYEQVKDLYKINTDAAGINKLYEMMCNDLLEQLGSKYSEAFIRRTKVLFNRFISKGNTRYYSYNAKNSGICRLPSSVSQNSFPDCFENIKIERFKQVPLESPIREKWNYCIDYKLIDMIKV